MCYHNMHVAATSTAANLCRGSPASEPGACLQLAWGCRVAQLFIVVRGDPPQYIADVCPFTCGVCSTSTSSNGLALAHSTAVATDVLTTPTFLLTTHSTTGTKLLTTHDVNRNQKQSHRTACSSSADSDASASR